MHDPNFSGERMLPSIAALLDQPFWLDPSDQHHMAAVMQVPVVPQPLQTTASAPRAICGHDQVYNERGLVERPIHRIVTESISPEQAVDDAIARIKEVLSE